MFQKVAWPAIIVVVLIFLALIQILRVNQPESRGVEGLTHLYTSKGQLASGKINIQAGDFFSKPLNLNRRSKLTGTFRTANLRSMVSTVVIDEKDLEAWKVGSEHNFLARTGYVPGGKINLVLEPGTYLLLIDNRESEVDLSLDADFQLE